MVMQNLVNSKFSGFILRQMKQKKKKLNFSLTREDLDHIEQVEDWESENNKEGSAKSHTVHLEEAKALWQMLNYFGFTNFFKLFHIFYILSSISEDA